MGEPWTHGYETVNGVRQHLIRHPDRVEFWLAKDNATHYTNTAVRHSSGPKGRLARRQSVRPRETAATLTRPPTCFTREGDRGRMEHRPFAMKQPKKIGLVAHDNKKQDLLEWAAFNRELLAQHELYATATTGKLLSQELGLDVIRLRSGPLGGDQQLGSRIAEGDIDFLIFFWDPLKPMPHDPDVKALLRVAVVWNIPVACNRASADFMISSPLMSAEYTRLLPDYEDHREQVEGERAASPRSADPSGARPDSAAREPGTSSSDAGPKS